MKKQRKALVSNVLKFWSLIDCSYCGSSFLKKTYRLKLSKTGTHFCNKVCRAGFDKGKKHTAETKALMRKSSYWKDKNLPLSMREKIGRTRIERGITTPRGPQNPLWRGRTSELRLMRHHTEYKIWRKAVFERDDYTCTLCTARNGSGKHVELQADHIKPFAFFPELRLDLSNGRTLCVPCHRKTDTYGGGARKYEPNKS